MRRHPSAPSEGPPAPGRRSFLKRAGLAAVGAAAASPIVGASRAQAAGTNPAYTDAPNTFTADQTISARLGVGTGSAQSPVHVVRPDPGSGLRIDAHTMAIEARHDTDWAGRVFDLVNLFHKSTGDAIFVVHQGGTPPGFTGQAGGNAAFNALIPQTLDNTRTGTGGTVVNDRDGMVGLHIEAQPAGSQAVNIRHWGDRYAFLLQTQPPGYVNQPTRQGGGIQIEDYSNESGILLNKRTAPGVQAGAITINGMTGAGPVNPINALVVVDNNATTRLKVTTDGAVRLFDAGNITRVVVDPAGKLSIGATNRFGLPLSVDCSGPSVQRGMALINSHSAVNDGIQIEFDDASAQYGVLRTTFDNVTPGQRSGSMRLMVRSGDVMTERLRLSGAGIGFFGALPVARPVVTGARGSSPALAGLLRALASLGLITDATSS
jgi:hypothetical protein